MGFAPSAEPCAALRIISRACLRFAARYVSRVKVIKCELRRTSFVIAHVPELDESEIERLESGRRGRHGELAKETEASTECAVESEEHASSRLSRYPEREREPAE